MKCSFCLKEFEGEESDMIIGLCEECREWLDDNGDEEGEE